MPKQRKFREELAADSPIWAKRINQCLIDSGMSQKELSMRSGIPEATISGWVSGDKTGKITEPKAQGLINLATALNVTIDFLLGKSETKRTENEEIFASTGLRDEAIHCFNAFTRERIGSPDLYRPTKTIKFGWLGSDEEIDHAKDLLLNNFFGDIRLVDVLSYMVDMIFLQIRTNVNNEEVQIGLRESRKIMRVDPHWKQALNDGRLIISTDEGSEFYEGVIATIFRKMAHEAVAKTISDLTGKEIPSYGEH